MLEGLLKLNSLILDLQSAAQGMVSTAVVERGAGWILALKTEFPYAYRLLMNALYEEPGDVLNVLIVWNADLAPLRGNKGVLNYIAQIQERIKGKQHG